MADFSAMATEIQDIIIQQIDKEDLLSIARCSKQLHSVGCRLLYRNVKVTGLHARKFFLTTMASSSTSTLCTSFIRRLSFVGDQYHDIWLSFPIFAEALGRMHNLTSLAIVIGQSPGSQHLLGHMTTHDIIRPFSHIFQPITDNLRILTRLTLPKLNELSIHGAPQLSRLARYRRLASLTLTDAINVTGLYEVIRNIQWESMDNASHLSIFEVTLDISEPSEITAVLLGLAECMPNLTSLTLRMNEVNPLLIGDIMSCKLTFFPKLRELSVNTTNDKHLTHPVNFASPKDQCLAQEERMLEKAAELRGSLERVRYGLHIWTRDPVCSTPKWKLSTTRIWEHVHFYGVGRQVAIAYRLRPCGSVRPWPEYINMDAKSISSATLG